MEERARPLAGGGEKAVPPPQGGYLRPITLHGKGNIDLYNGGGGGAVESESKGRVPAAVRRSYKRRNGSGEGSKEIR